MQYQELGTSGVKASRVAMGVMRLAGKTREDAKAIVGTALDAGVDFFDTADIYGAGESSRVLGQALRDLGVRREDVVLQTKFGIFPDPTGARDSRYDFTREHLLESLDAELDRLQTDYVDFVLLHRFDTLADMVELRDTFDELAASGKVRHFGVSNMGPWTVELLQHNLNQRLEVNQLQFGLMHAGMIKMQLHENMEDDAACDRDGGVLAYSQLRNMTIQAWSPVQYGMFAGTFIDNDAFPELNEKLAEVASAHGATKEAIATAWIFRHPAKMQVISGSMTPERIANVAAAADIEIDRQEWWDLYHAAGNDLP